MGTPTDAARSIAATVVREHAEEVDRDARFPQEAVTALREARLMSCAVPVELGGDGCSLGEVGAVVQALGEHCASTAMIFAMHQIQVLCLVRHGGTEAARQLLQQVVREQLLLASATTEIGIGGDVRSSSCHVADGRAGRVVLTKNAPVISYGEHADVVLATARRSSDSPPSDQVLVVCPRADLRLEPTGTWDTLGFRGTCSPGFLLHADVPAELVLPEPYAEVSAQTMLPVSHVLWGHVWLGIAVAATARARRYVQQAARRTPGTVPPGAVRLVELTALVQQLRDLVTGAAQRFDDAPLGSDVLTSIGFAVAMNNLKVTASGLVVDAVGQAMLICGISAYREDNEFRLGRHLRDAHGAALMVNNDRIIANNAQLVLVHRGTS
ncbi:acyl-CoA dehydrogenase family protein [Rhodococcus sp. X156]|uniref:acyl-CoA dehydrogenase family protein n=1 Tax=Rhodococcus sp. X156 TaxID=2499145 RepID=UPI000FDA138A|nr:acyl-CoA dehydrogenase family protein [Rhodococcus sp. X156]